MKKKKDPRGRKPLGNKKRVVVWFTAPPKMARWIQKMPSKSDELESILAPYMTMERERVRP